jgi:penicillin-binding protein 1A
MSSGDNHRRTYGYTSKTNQTNNQTHGYTKTKVVVFGWLKKQKVVFWILLSPIIIAFFVIKSLFWVWKKRPKLRTETKSWLWKKAGSLTLVGVVFVFLVGTIMVAWASRDLPDPDKLTDRKVAQSTKIFDRTGEHLLYEVYSQEKRTLVELDQVPQYLINGVIATEDTEFFQHKGIRPLSILRAVVYGVFTNKRIGGTSTLTQQLVKNAVLTNERKITRKIKEIILSIRLEQKYTKEQILKIYFNEIPYGSTNYGVESAAQSYFGKHVSAVTLAEAATLAGLPKAPSLYLNDPEKLKNRRDFVLERMVAEGYLSRAEADAAQTEPLIIKQKIENIQAPHFTL